MVCSHYLPRATANQKPGKERQQRARSRRNKARQRAGSQQVRSQANSGVGAPHSWHLMAHPSATSASMGRPQARPRQRLPLRGRRVRRRQRRRRVRHLSIQRRLLARLLLLLRQLVQLLLRNVLLVPAGAAGWGWYRWRYMWRYGRGTPAGKSTEQCSDAQTQTAAKDLAAGGRKAGERQACVRHPAHQPALTTSGSSAPRAAGPQTAAGCYAAHQSSASAHTACDAQPLSPPLILLGCA